MQRALSAAAALLFLAGCGGGSSHTYTPSAARLPACAHAGKAIAMPSGFPADFPFPDGSAITSAKKALKVTVVKGVIPITSFKDTASFFTREVRNAGFKVLYSEADPPRDAEGSYRGHGYAGRWTLEHLPACSEAVAFAAFAQPSAG